MTILVIIFYTSLAINYFYCFESFTFALHFFRLKSHSIFSEKDHSSRTKLKNKTKYIPFKNRKKPQWVVNEIIRLSVLMPKVSVRILAKTFNQIYHNKETVSKSWVHRVVLLHRHTILLKRKNMKHRIPKPEKPNKVWGLDLTFVTDVSGKQKIILGVVEHASRACLVLQSLPSKHSARLILQLTKVIKQYGFPQHIRTDNERVFTGWYFRWALKLLGINHQKTKLASPWMNGRVERFFGTLKNKLNDMVIDNSASLNVQLQTFRLWYNYIRPHYHLHYKTPAQVWSKTGSLPNKNATYFSAWQGRLSGYYFER